MQYSQVKMSGSGPDHTLLVVGLDFLVEGATVEVYGVPLLGRGDGFLICLPHGVIDDTMMLEGNYPASYPSWLGVGSMFEVALVEEADDGSVVPLGVAGPVSVIDVGNELLARLLS